MNPSTYSFWMSYTYIESYTTTGVNLYKISQQHLIQEIYLILRVEWTTIYKVIITMKCWGKVTTPYIICLKCGLVFYIMSAFWHLTTHNFIESVNKKNEKLSLATCIEFDNVIVFLKTRIASKRSLIFLHWPNNSQANV